MAVALDRTFYETLPTMDEVPEADAEMAWLIYDLRLDAAEKRYVLESHRVMYTAFEPALMRITRADAGVEDTFISKLQAALDRKFDSDTNASDTTAKVDFTLGR